MIVLVLVLMLVLEYFKMFVLVLVLKPFLKCLPHLWTKVIHTYTCTDDATYIYCLHAILREYTFTNLIL